MTMTKMLINATRSQMLRVAIVEGTILQEYQVEIAEGEVSPAATSTAGWWPTSSPA